MKRNRTLLSFVFFLFVFIPLSGFAQNLGPDDELYLRDPDPRYNGEQVRALQRFLLFNGMDIGPDGMDGWFGKDTDKALRAYQQAQGLPVTGRIRIKDFIDDPLEWDPYYVSYLFTGRPEGPYPSPNSQYKTFTADILRDFHYESYYGEITIESGQIGYQLYQVFLLSPGERFLAAVNGAETEIVVWDILSGTQHVYIFDEFVQKSSYRDENATFSDFKLERLFWWNDPFGSEKGAVTLFVEFTCKKNSQEEYRSSAELHPNLYD